MDMYDSSTLNIYGGTVGLLLFTHDSSTVNVYDGVLGLIMGLDDSSTLNVYSGSIWVFLSDISLLPTATVNIYGYGFEYNPRWFWSDALIFGRRWVSLLTGYGFDGDTITIEGLLDPATHQKINLIPEPITFLLLGAGGLALLKNPAINCGAKYS